MHIRAFKGHQINPLNSRMQIHSPAMSHEVVAVTISQRLLNIPTKCDVNNSVRLEIVVFGDNSRLIGHDCLTKRGSGTRFFTR